MRSHLTAVFVSVYIEVHIKDIPKVTNIMLISVLRGDCVAGV